MRRSTLVLSVMVPALIVGIAGCGTAKTPLTNDTTQSTSINTTSSNATSTSNSTTQSTPQETSFGWRYVEIPQTFGAHSQISAIDAIDGKIVLTVMSEQTTGDSIHQLYSIGSYQLGANQLTEPEGRTNSPKGYQGSWKLTFGQMNGHKAISMALTNQATSISIPSSIPAYASEINPAPGNPGSFDNRILGRTGNWVWIAMKGPGEPPIPALVWGYRHWNRIMAVNTQTQRTRVFSIPNRTSETDTWSTTPAFSVAGNTVYIATGNWIGTFPADPTNPISAPILAPEPQYTVTADETAMLTTLRDLETQAATGITGFWNNYVMKGDQKTRISSWIEDPAIYNHGDYPSTLYWALSFPLTPGTQAYNQRATLIQEIQQLLKSPLIMTWIAYPDPASMRSHFHSTPPTQVPGYHIVNGYYVKG